MSTAAGTASDERKQALANAVAREVGGGWHVESQTDYQAVLVRPATRINHVLHLLLTLITFGLWAIVWIFLAITHKRERHRVILVDGFGNVTVQNR